MDEPDVITSSVSFGFLHPGSTLSDPSKLQLAPSIRSCKLWCQARPLLALVPLATKMSASELSCYFSSHPAAFWFQFSTPPDNITLNPANRKADQSLSEFQTGIGAAAHATLDMEQLISHLILREELYLCPKSWITYQGSWHSGQCCVQMSWELSLYFSTFFILHPGSIVRSGLHSSPFFIVLRMFLLMRLACMAI